MAKILDRDEEIEMLDRNLAKLNRVKKEFPDFQLKLDTSNGEYLFSDKTVNKLFNSFQILDHSSELRLRVSYDIPFEWNGKLETIKIGCVPKSCKLLHVYNYWNSKNDSPQIYYFKPTFKSKDKDLQFKLSSSCNIKIIDTIKKFPHAKIDQKSFPEKLKKLLIFS